MRKHALIATTIFLLIGAALPSASVIAQETAQRIVYTRSTGEFDLPEENEIFIMATSTVQTPSSSRTTLGRRPSRTCPRTEPR